MDKSINNQEFRKVVEKNVKKTRRKRTGISRVFSLLGVLLIVAVVAACGPLTIPRFMGYQLYSVIEDSMEPELPVDSLVYVEKVKAESISTDDVIAYYGEVGDGVVAMHRVVLNDIPKEAFTTKGDVNEEPDPGQVEYRRFIGKVAYHIPYMGKVLLGSNTNLGKTIIIVCVIAAVVLFLIGENFVVRKIDESWYKKDISNS